MTLELSIPLIILVGLGASILASLIGLGGGLVAIPLIMLVIGGDHPTQAKLISYVNLTFLSLISAIKYYRFKRKPKWKEAFFIMLGVVPLTIIASIYITPIFNKPDYKPYYHLAYVIVALSVSILMYFKDKINVQKPKPWLLIIMGMGIGILSGSIGLSGGILFIPILVVGLKVSLKEAAVTSLILKLAASSANILTNIGTGEFDSSFQNFTGSITINSVPGILAVVILVGSFFGSQIGPVINTKIDNKLMTRLFFIVMAFIITWEFIQAIYSLSIGTSII